MYRLLSTRSGALRGFPTETVSETTTDSCKVRIESRLRSVDLDFQHPQFLFEYHVQISNVSTDRPFVLVSRKLQFENWHGETITVEGSGVIGQHPQVDPGGSHLYSSSVSLTTPLGAMSGTYQMVDLEQGRTLNSVIGRTLLNATCVATWGGSRDNG